MPKGVGLDLIRDRDSETGLAQVLYPSNEAALRQLLQRHARTVSHDRFTNFQPGEPAAWFLEANVQTAAAAIYRANLAPEQSHPLTTTDMRRFTRQAQAFTFTPRGPLAAEVLVTVESEAPLLPYPLAAAATRLTDQSGRIVFMPAIDTTITTATQEVVFVAGDLLTNQVGVTTGLRGQTIPFDREQPVEGSVFVRVGAEVWTQAPNWPSQPSTARVFLLEWDGEDATVQFGDGTRGALPPKGLPVIVTWKRGGGLVSNVPEGALRVLRDPPPGMKTATNRVKAEGGDDPQTLAEAQVALPAAASANHRAVSDEDHASVFFDGTLRPPATRKASSVSVGQRLIRVWLEPAGGGPMTDEFRSDCAAYLRQHGFGGRSFDVLDPTPARVLLTLGIFAEPGYRGDVLVGLVREALITETTVPGSRPLDDLRLGLGGVDDGDTPQLTESRLHQLVRPIPGLTRIVVERLTARPASRAPLFRTNVGNGTAEVVSIHPLLTRRRQFALLFETSTKFRVVRRILGVSEYMTDNVLRDPNLTLGAGLLPDFPFPLPLGTKVNPNIRQASAFDVDVGASAGSVIRKVANNAGSLFNVAAPSDRYYLEIPDGTSVLPGPVNTEVGYGTLGNDAVILVKAGTKAFAAGDIVLVEVYPERGDLDFDPSQRPTFIRDAAGNATDFVVQMRSRS